MRNYLGPLVFLAFLTLTLDASICGASGVGNPTRTNPAATPTAENQDDKAEKEPTVARENTVIKSKVELLGGTLRRLLRRLKEGIDPRVELVFLVDSSASVGAQNFFNEIRFVRKLLSDFTVSSDAVRVALVTFSSRNRIVRHIDHLHPRSKGYERHKCSLMQEELPRITYTGGGTYTLGAMLEAEDILRHARRGARRVVFLITDGYSNGGDPRPVARRLKEMRSGRPQRKGSEDGAETSDDGKGKRNQRNTRGVEIFTFGIRNGNTEELLAMATDKDHTFILGSFKEFEALGRRAFHQDLQIGAYLTLNNTSCNKLCNLEKSDKKDASCCDPIAECACGTISGHYSCICPPGYYGSGLRNDCYPCPMGTYNPGGNPGDVHTSCRRCPDPNQTTKREGATSPDECECEEGFIPDARGVRCLAVTCPPLHPPENGYFAKTISGKKSGRRRAGRASRDRGANNNGNKRTQAANRESCRSLTFKSSCGVRCRPGFTLVGSHIRTCGANGRWTGHDALCVIKKCPSLRQPKDGSIYCEEKQGPYKANATIVPQGHSEGFLPNTVCHFECNHGYHLVGSEKRTCLTTGIWDGLQVYCKAKSCPPLQLLPHGKVFPPACTDRQQLSSSLTSCLLVCDPGYILWGVREQLEWETNQGKLVCGPEGNWELTNPEIGTTKELLAWQRVKWMGGRCVDVEPPTINCPNNITVETERDKKFATVHWDQPDAFDNSGVPVTINVVPAISWPAKLPIGDNEVTIVARDANRNKAKCKFLITVIDKQPPTIHVCETPPPFVLPSNPSVVIADTGIPRSLMAHGLTWNQPVFEDNSGLDVTVEVKAYMESLLEPTLWEGLEGGQGEAFPVGDTVIHYTVFDTFGNNNTCEIIISVRDHACPVLPDPINGNSNCSKGREMDATSLLCTLTCSDGYAFPVSTPQEYFCSPQMEMTLSETVEIGFNNWGQQQEPSNPGMVFNGMGQNDFITWEPQETLPFADCMVAAIPNTLQQEGLIFMDGDNSICNDSAFFHQVEESVRRKISEKLAEICGIGLVGIQCEIVGEIEQVCESLVSTAEEEANVVMASSVSRTDQTHGKGEKTGGGKARKGRRNGGKGLRRKKLQEDIKKKRRGEQVGKGREGRRGGRLREQRRKKEGRKGREFVEKNEDEQMRERKEEQVKATQPMEMEILSETHRKKRSLEEISHEDSLETVINEDGEDIENDDYDEEESETEKPGGQNNGIGIYFKMVGPIKNLSAANRSKEEVALMNAIERARQALEEAIKKGDFDIDISNVTSLDGSEVTNRKLTGSIGFEPPRLGCNKGSVLTNDLCVKCPSGTFWDEMNEECVLCEKGTYQPLEGQTFCIACPDGFSTNVGRGRRSRRKAISLDDCIPKCPPGAFSLDGLVPCSTCAKGFFMELSGAQNCTACPINKTTINRGAKTLDDCVDFCPPGMISETGLLPCYPCPNGYSQINSGKTFCKKYTPLDESAPFENTTSISEFGYVDGENKSDILPFNECLTLPCKNGGTCYTLTSSTFVCGCELGFMGTFCELEENMCASDPCLNSGNCTTYGVSYTCSCPTEYTGMNCELNGDACSTYPCLNGGACNVIEPGYECICPPDYQGNHCESAACEFPPCHSNDTCVYNGEDWDCLCGSDSSEECIAEEMKLFDDEPGIDDDEFLDPDSVLHFDKSGTTNYILVNGYMERNYTKITLCGWMNTKDRSNYGTIFSLASPGSDNAFVLKDYSGFVIYVDGNSAVTDIAANDGKWHHFCLSWASREGKWQLYYDGILAAKGESLSPGYSIPGQGTIVLGQEQDWEGGGFSETESFVGRLTLVTLENKVITADEAFLRATFCKSGETESMIWSWADFLTERQGTTVVEKSPLCKQCPTLSPPKNGHVVILSNEDEEKEESINGLVVKYSCINNFTLGKGQEIRRCLHNATWDGKQPTCKRASCDLLESDSCLEKTKDNSTLSSTKRKGKKKVENSHQVVNQTDTEVEIVKAHVVPEEEISLVTKMPPINNTKGIVFNRNTSEPVINFNNTENIIVSNKENAKQPDEINPKKQETMKCIGPLGIGRLYEWTSYGEVYGLGGSQIKQRRGLFSEGSKIDVECDIGFQLHGSSRIVCSNGGKWRNWLGYSTSTLKDVNNKRERNDEEGEIVDLPRCIPVPCGPPPEINQGAWEIMERKHWNGGEGLRWTKVWNDQSTGVDVFMSEDELKNIPENPLPTSNAGEEFKYGDVAEYDCEYGYALAGPQAVHCSGNGMWIWSNRHSHWPGLEYASSQYPAHKWPHNRDIQHSLSKVVEPAPPVCLPIRCPTPPPPLNGGFVERRVASDPKIRKKHLEHPEAYYVGDEVMNTCKAKNEGTATAKRRLLIGPRIRRCLPSGQWSSYRPKCEN